MYDLIIVGGGPAGLTAAVYAIRKRLKVFLISQDLGGKTNYRFELPKQETHQIIRGAEVVEKFWQELDYLDFARHLAPVVSLEKHGDTFVVKTAGGTELHGRSVILATGSQVRQLNVPGEDKFIGRGLSYSAVSHAPLFVGKQVMVIGDGDLALRAVAELSLTAQTVHLVAQSGWVLETPLLQRLASHLKIVLWTGYAVKEIQGDDFVKRVIIEAADHAQAEIDVDGVFVELGLLPNSQIVANLASLDERGRVIIDSLNRTSCTGLFAAGDVTTAYAEQVLIAIGEGAKAMLSAYDFLLPRL